MRSRRTIVRGIDEGQEDENFRDEIVVGLEDIHVEMIWAVYS
jgi:hypothetical protein